MDPDNATAEPVGTRVARRWPGGVTPRALRDVAGQFPTGVTVVGIPGAAGPHAVTVNSFTSVSLDPALVLICLRRGSRSETLLRAVRSFSVNLLADHQGALARWFAVPDRPRGGEFDGVPHSISSTGAPVLDETVGYLDCVRAQDWVAGDHTVFIGAVVDLAVRHDRSPLIFHRGDYHNTA